MRESEALLCHLYAVKSYWSFKIPLRCYFFQNNFPWALLLETSLLLPASINNILSMFLPITSHNLFHTFNYLCVHLIFLICLLGLGTPWRCIFLLPCLHLLVSSETVRLSSGIWKPWNYLEVRGKVVMSSFAEAPLALRTSLYSKVCTLWKEPSDSPLLSESGAESVVPTQCVPSAQWLWL